MPNTMYASTPSPLNTPALPAPFHRHVVPVGRRGDGDTRLPVAPTTRIAADASEPLDTSVATTDAIRSAVHRAEARRLYLGLPATSAAEPGLGETHPVYLFPAASEPFRQGFVRVINHSIVPGQVRIEAMDDNGRSVAPLTLSIDAYETVHFNSNDLESGNEAKGLEGATGVGEGSWRLDLSSDLDIEVLAYIRTDDGFLTAMNDVAPVTDGRSRIVTFNPGSNRNQVSRLRIINPGPETAAVTVRGRDDRGGAGTSTVALSVQSGTVREITAAELEHGSSGFDGALGDGLGKWRLDIDSAQPIVVMSLLESPTGHLTNLSSASPGTLDGVHAVPMFPLAGDATGRQGFARIINHSDSAGTVTMRAYDESAWDYEPITLSIGANEVVHFNSDDLEFGNAAKGLSAGVGSGIGDWRLDLRSELDIEVLSYIRTTDGFLTAMHDVAPSLGDLYRVAVFNPGSNQQQQSLLRLINPGTAWTANVTIRGVDGNGNPAQSAVHLSMAAESARTVSAQDLELGTALDGSLGDGSAKWQLTVTSDQPIHVMSLLRSPTGHLTNLSTAPSRGAQLGALGNATAAATSISAVVQSKCSNCHVEGGPSGHTRLVFVSDAASNDATNNLAVFETFLSAVPDGGNLILRKIQGVDHGGGIQVGAGTDAFGNMEQFLASLGADITPSTLSPDALFNNVTFESERSTLRRAAIVLAGRIPTQEEYAALPTRGLRDTVRGLMQGPGFHDFLIRGANDRLLTDRERRVIDNSPGGTFVEFHREDNKRTLKALEAYEDPWQSPNYRRWRDEMEYGAGRAPLELIAYVAKNDLPYTKVLTADYIMANPPAAVAYGADTVFVDTADVHEFQPSRITSYYRNCEGRVLEQDPVVGERVVDPGPCATVYPHAGLLNATVFPLRYPTTATNRNRARARWVYYHFLGVDIEKSASRTTDPEALADTNNPTMHNAACTVCHSVLDPLAGAFQNYDEVGLYRSGYGGADSLDDDYKYGLAPGQDSEIHAPIESSRDEIDVVRVKGFLGAGRQEIGLFNNVWAYPGLTSVHVEYLTLRDDSGSIVEHFELVELGQGDPVWDGRSFELWEPLFVPVQVPASGTYTVEVGARRGVRDETAQGDRGVLRISVGGAFYREGDTWYRDMRAPGFYSHKVPNAASSLAWVAEQITQDPRFAVATVKFWWPALMGADVVEPPTDGNGIEFEGALLASQAQAAEADRLATMFRIGVRGGNPYNLKDLLTEIVLTKWFRVDSVRTKDAAITRALMHAGARRLLTPEELAQKTSALTGFRWNRRESRDHPWIRTDDWSSQYGLLYGGIDSNGITKRNRDFTSVMAGIAARNAAETSCPVIMRELYLLPDGERRLFAGIDPTVTPISEFSGSFAIKGDSWSKRETFVLSGNLPAGNSAVAITFTNDYADEGGDRNVHLYWLRVRNSKGTLIEDRSLRDLEPALHNPCGDGHSWNLETNEHDNFTLWSTCGAVEAALEIPSAGHYTIELVTWADQYGDESARLAVAVTSETNSAGEQALRSKLVELHDKFLGTETEVNSPEVQTAFNLFVEVWRRGRTSGEWSGIGAQRCDIFSDIRSFDGIADHLWRTAPDANGNQLGWDWEQIDEFWSRVDWSDAHYAARAWVVVLAFLMTDPRYLHL